MLEFFYETVRQHEANVTHSPRFDLQKEIFQLKELEKRLPKEKGISESALSRVSSRLTRW